MARRNPQGPRDTKLREMRDALPAAWRQVADIYLRMCRKLFDEQAVGIDLVWTRIDPREPSQGMASLGETLGVRKVGYACLHLARYEVADVCLTAPTLDGTWALVATVNVPADGALAARLENGFSRTVLMRTVQGSCCLFVARPHIFGCAIDAMDPPDGESAGDSTHR